MKRWPATTDSANHSRPMPSAQHDNSTALPVTALCRKHKSFIFTMFVHVSEKITIRTPTRCFQFREFFGFD